MRLLALLFLLAFLGALGYFAYQNQESITVTLHDRTVTAPLPLIAALLYLLGMLTGWVLVRLLRKSVGEVIASDQRR